jgi:hypothetical protein
MLKATAIITWKAGAINLWLGCTAVLFTDKASVLSDAGALIGAAGVVLLAIATVATFCCGVRALCIS